MEDVRPHRTGHCILIADDHRIFSESLRPYLEKTYGVVGVVHDGRTMVAEAIRLQPDVIVVDVGIPRLNGLDAARRIKIELRKIDLVFLTIQDDPNLVAATLEFGRDGLVLKHSTGQELLKAIDHVLHGKPYLTPTFRARDWVETKSRSHQFSKELSPRRRDIVQLIAEGRCIKEITALLEVRQKTVEFHKHHIKKSFNLKTNADVVLFAFKQGLISLNRWPLGVSGVL